MQVISVHARQPHRPRTKQWGDGSTQHIDPVAAGHVRVEAVIDGQTRHVDIPREQLSVIRSQA